MLSYNNMNFVITALYGYLQNHTESKRDFTRNVNTNKEVL